MCLAKGVKVAPIMTGWKFSQRPDKLEGFRGGPQELGKWINAGFSNYGASHLETWGGTTYPIGFHACKHLNGIKKIVTNIMLDLYGDYYKKELFVFKVELQGLLASGYDHSNSQIGDMNIPSIVAARLKAPLVPQYYTKVVNGKVHFCKYKG